MSYPVFIWQSPVPKSTIEAEALLESRNVQTGEKAKQAFADAVVAEYGSELVPGSIWADEPYFPPEQPMISLGLASETLPDSLLGVVHFASKGGLVTYDPQTGRVYLPTGEQLLADGSTRMVSLKPAKRKPKPKAKPKLRLTSKDPNDIQVAIDQEVEELLTPLGFRRNTEVSFRRKFKGGSDIVSWLGCRRGGRRLMNSLWMCS
jgi:hypothetical protein